MGSISKTIKKLDPIGSHLDRGGDLFLEKAGLPTLTGDGEHSVFDMGKTAQAEAAKQAAEAQAQATRDAANVQAQATRDAANQQAASLRDQASAATAAQTASINQAAVAARLAEQQASQQQEEAPDIRLNSYGDGNDPRRRYQAGGGAPSIGGTYGGVGIRL